jgi:hypothetical protein
MILGWPFLHAQYSGASINDACLLHDGATGKQQPHHLEMALVARVLQGVPPVVYLLLVRATVEEEPRHLEMTNAARVLQWGAFIVACLLRVRATVEQQHVVSQLHQKSNMS